MIASTDLWPKRCLIFWKCLQWSCLKAVSVRTFVIGGLWGSTATSGTCRLQLWNSPKWSFDLFFSWSFAIRSPPLFLLTWLVQSLSMDFILLNVNTVSHLKCVLVWHYLYVTLVRLHEHVLEEQQQCWTSSVIYKCILKTSPYGNSLHMEDHASFGQRLKSLNTFCSACWRCKNVFAWFPWRI